MKATRGAQTPTQNDEGIVNRLLGGELMPERSTVADYCQATLA
jgi:hypothetical protein